MTPEDLIDTLDADARDAKELAEAARRVVAERDEARAERNEARSLLRAKDEYIGRFRGALGAMPGESAINAATRVVAERDEARAERGPARQDAIMVDRNAIRMAHASLGSKWGERLPDAAARVVRERDEARAERDEARAERDEVLSQRDKALAEHDLSQSLLKGQEAYIESIRLALGARPEEITANAAARVVAERDCAKANHQIFSEWLAARKQLEAKPRKPKVGDRIRILEYYEHGATVRRHDLEGLATVKIVCPGRVLEGRLDNGKYFLLNQYDRWEFVA